MVLWELTAITAYFLGLRRTYRLALRIQRRRLGEQRDAPGRGHLALGGRQQPRGDPDQT